MPAYNEEANIKKSVTVLYREVEKILNDFELIVVDDGSKDKTPQVVRDMAKTMPKLRIVRHRKNLGYGSAIKSGLRASKKNWIFFADSDGQFDYRQIKLFLSRAEGFDIVIGYREKRADPLIRLINSQIFNLSVKILYRFWVRDVNCAFKLLSADAYAKIAPLSSTGALISAEMLIKAKRAKMKILELPVKHLPRKKGVQTGANPAVIARSLREIIELRKYL